MAMSRRDVLLGSAGALGAASFSFPAPAIAQSEPIKIGCLAAITGPSSAPTVGFNRGVNFAVDAINGAGGVKGRVYVAALTEGDPVWVVSSSGAHAASAAACGIAPAHAPPGAARRARPTSFAQHRSP